ncbi:MAG: hypothetical protein ACRCTS_03505 [Fusobacteriaceae bacterium]
MLNNLYTKNFQSNISKSLLNTNYSIYIYNDYLIQNNEIVVNNKPDLSAVKQVDTETLAQARGGIITNETLNEKTINLEMTLQPAGKTEDLVLEQREIKRIEDKVKKIFDENGSLAIMNCGEMKEVWSAEVASSGTIVGGGAITDLRVDDSCGFQLSNTNFTGEIDTTESNTLTITSISNCEMDLSDVFDVENYKNRPVIGMWIFVSEAEIFTGLNSIKLYLGSSQSDFVAWDTSQMQGSLTNYLGQPIKAGWNFVTLPISSKVGGNFVPLFGTVGNPDFTKIGKFLFVEVGVSSSQSTTRKISINSLVSYNTNELRAIDCVVENIPTMDRFRLAEGLVVPYNVDLINASTKVYSPYTTSILELSTGDPFTGFSFILDGNGEQFPIVNIAPTSFVNSINLGFTNGSFLTLRKSFSDLTLNFASNDILELDFFNQTFKVNNQNAEWQGSFPVLKDGDNKGFIKLNYTVGGVDVNFDFETSASPFDQEASPNNGYRNDLNFEIEFTPDIDYFFNSAELDVQTSGTFSTGQNLRILDENNNVIYSNNESQDLNLFENINQPVYLDKDKVYTFKYSKTVFNTVNRQGLPPICGVVFGATKPTIEVQTKAITDLKFNFVSGSFTAYTDTVFNAGLNACVPSTLSTNLTNSPYLKLNLTRTFESEFFTDTEFDTLTSPVLTDNSLYLKSNDLDIVYKGNLTFNSGSPEKIRRFEFRYKLEDGANLTGIVNAGVINAIGQITINKTVPENYTISYDSHSLNVATNELTINATISGEVVLNDSGDLDYTFTTKNTSGINKLFAISGDPTLIVADSQIIKRENIGNLTNKLLHFRYPAVVFKENPQGGYYIADKEKVCSYDKAYNFKWGYIDTADGDIVDLAVYPDGKVVICKEWDQGGANGTSAIIQRVLNPDGTENATYNTLPIIFANGVNSGSLFNYFEGVEIINNRFTTIRNFNNSNWEVYYYEPDYTSLRKIIRRRGLAVENNSFYSLFDDNSVTPDYRIRKYDMPATGEATQDLFFFPNTQIKNKSLLIDDGFIYGVDTSTNLLKKINLADDTAITTVNYGGNFREILGFSGNKVYVQREAFSFSNRIDEFNKADLTFSQSFQFSSGTNADDILINRNLLAISRTLDTKNKGLEILNPTQNQLYEVNENGFNNQLVIRAMSEAEALISGSNFRFRNSYPNPDLSNPNKFYAFSISALNENYPAKRYNNDWTVDNSFSCPNSNTIIGDYNGDVWTFRSGELERRDNSGNLKNWYSRLGVNYSSVSFSSFGNLAILPLTNGNIAVLGLTGTDYNRGGITTAIPSASFLILRANDTLENNAEIIFSEASSAIRKIKEHNNRIITANKVYDLAGVEQFVLTAGVGNGLAMDFDILPNGNIIFISNNGNIYEKTITGTLVNTLTFDPVFTFSSGSIEPRIMVADNKILICANQNTPPERTYDGTTFIQNLTLNLDYTVDDVQFLRRSGNGHLGFANLETSDFVWFTDSIIPKKAQTTTDVVNYTRLVTGDIAEDVGTNSSISIRQTPNFI